MSTGADWHGEDDGTEYVAVNCAPGAPLARVSSNVGCAAEAGEQGSTIAAP
jgi:hypothetical protein